MTGGKGLFLDVVDAWRERIFRIRAITGIKIIGTERIRAWRVFAGDEFEEVFFGPVLADAFWMLGDEATIRIAHFR